MIKSTLELIYRFMKVKGIGTVQTNKLLLSINGKLDFIQFEKQIRKVLDDSQKREFDNEQLNINYSKFKYPIGFISLLDNGYPEDLKRNLATNTPCEETQYFCYLADKQLFKIHYSIYR